ncbi:DUF397 domain-containing protein [Saccharopolyspora spinosa]|uniref:Uncharacterized protein DUF397 n=1 Tax=Saccharopolyspora spinosa TaxID=60894 RepID=A0A2N3XXD4_SACSN|nr:DUF397 domain-containing protein [Saccharopolyspora spinosa]PKW15291.1 uncharacterized protein DUF397 [Saccharopolyspora spinosa]
MMKLVVNGAELGFVKATRSHIDGKECLHVAADGDNVHLVESDNKAVILSTTRVKFAAFVDGARKGEFDFAC